MAATMRDVAQQAGVSIKTVSRVVNNQGEIADTTRQRVLEAIEDLGYRPSRVARALVTQRTNTIGLVVGDITNPFFPEIARGVQDAAQIADYNVFLCNTDGNPEQELSTLESLAGHGVDGIIIYPSYESIQNLTTFAAYYRPLVVVNYPFEHTDVALIMVDNRKGARLAVDHFVSNGHANIGMLTGIQSSSLDKVRRIQGFKDALCAHNLPVVEDWIVPGTDPTFESGYRTTKKLLQEYPQITAIFTYNDLLALGAIRACSDMGLNVPNDCAIIGFDDIQWAATSTPQLTTVRVDKYDLGRRSLNRILEMLAQPDAVFPKVALDVELVVRESA